jgi:membrane-associated progesterone receptor component
MERHDDVDIPLKDLQLPKDFSAENPRPVSLGDLWVQIMEKFQDTRIYAQALQLMTKLKEGDLKSMVIVGASFLVGTMLVYRLFFDGDGSSDINNDADKVAEETKEIEQRDFTIEQLREFDGSDDKAIYIALKGDVFDVSGAKQFYGEGSGYNCFAGRDATRAMAKLSFEEADLANSSIEDLGPFERDVLNDWYSKFRDYKCYPIIGRVSKPDPADRTFTVAQLAESKNETTAPAGRVDIPLLMGINGKVIDVSYGGKEMYGKGGPYNLFVGVDASRALAKMSFKEEDLNSRETGDLTPEQQKTLAQWETKFIDARKYPVVGTIVN